MHLHASVALNFSVPAFKFDAARVNCVEAKHHQNSGAINGPAHNAHASDTALQLMVKKIRDMRWRFAWSISEWKFFSSIVRNDGQHLSAHALVRIGSEQSDHRAGQCQAITTATEPCRCDLLFSIYREVRQLRRQLTRLNRLSNARRGTSIAPLRGRATHRLESAAFIRSGSATQRYLRIIFQNEATASMPAKHRAVRAPSSELARREERLRRKILMPLARS